jgi:hypothetical protein
MECGNLGLLGPASEPLPPQTSFQEVETEKTSIKQRLNVIVITADPLGNQAGKLSHVKLI